MIGGVSCGKVTLTGIVHFKRDEVAVVPSRPGTEFEASVAD
jgi:hypothetical protein